MLVIVWVWLLGCALSVQSARIFDSQYEVICTAGNWTGEGEICPEPSKLRIIRTAPLDLMVSFG